MMSFPPEHFAGARVTVMGLGHFGGQVAAVRFLVAQGATVTVTDIAPAEKLSEALEQISDLPVTLHLGGHIESDFTDSDLIVVSPAVPKDSRYLRLAMDSGIPVTCEMNLFLTRCRAKVIGITGTVGKSTSVAMLKAILDHARTSELKRLGYGKVWMGGNIGQSLLEQTARIKTNDLVVLELSSFQLDDLGYIEYSPQIAVVTNIFPNHLDRHPSMHEYVDAKANITRYQSPGDVLIINGDDPTCAQLAEIAPSDLDVWRFGVVEGEDKGDAIQIRLTTSGDCWALSSTVPGHSGELVTSDELPVLGRHNMQNAAAASAAALALGLDVETIRQALRSYKPLPDRLELVADHEGVRWYNDSKSTTPQSGIVAIHALGCGTTIAIAGGYDKGLDLSEFAKVLAERTLLTICLGQTGDVLANLVQTFGGSAIRVKDLEQAVREASQRAVAGQSVVLSPGCSSWDMFDNYRMRGDRFRELVHEVTEGVPTR